MMTNETLFAGNCIRTFSGLYMDVFSPTSEMVSIEDIAHALSHVCRFAGHTKLFYSVAQHSILVASQVPNELKLTALLHDASEAYLGDMPRPIKKRMPAYKELEAAVSKVIHEKFGLTYSFDHPEIKKYDLEELENEHKILMLKEYSTYNFCWSPEKSKNLFLEHFKKYVNL